MRFASFSHGGRTGFGLATDEGVIDLTRRLEPNVETLKEAIAEGLLPDAARFVGRAVDLRWSEVEALPVIPDPNKILCVGLNYETHRAETRRPDAKYPTIFTRFADTQIGDRQPILKPAISDMLDYEGELAVVIGLGGRDIAEEDALAHVAGYACYNDVTVRDWQRHTHQFIPGKNFPATGCFGPFLATPDEVGDHTRLAIRTRLNGVVMQEATIADLIFPVARLIAYVSAFTPLAPGDVIATGTPGGVGDRREPPVYMRPGDLIEVEIDKLGRLSNPVAAEA